MKKFLVLSASAVAVAMTPALALAADPATVAAPDFSAITDYILAAIPVGAAALGVAIMAAAAWTLLAKLGKKITGGL